MGDEINRITGPGNYYGSVAVWECEGKFWMGVENWDGWGLGDEISPELYAEFVKQFEEPTHDR